nr:DUF2867 domain-containing protein [uncultured Carboxylicivirga sp.]
MSKKVLEENLELTKTERNWLTRIDFADTFSTTNHTNNLKEITNLVFNTTPQWIKALFTIRNKMVEIIGIKTKIPEDYNEDFKVGGYVKFFKIYSISENKVVLGADDSHLNFRAIIKNDHTEKYNIKVTTLVEYNNSTGRMYMKIIKPFHRQVVKRLVANACNKK